MKTIGQLSLNTIVIILMVLIGSDRFSFALFGFNIRVINFFLVLSFAIVSFKRGLKVDRKSTFYFLLFLIPFILSALVSSYSFRGLGYTIWLIFNYFFVYILFFNLSLSSKNIIALLRTSFELVGILSSVQFLFSLFSVQIPFLYTNYYGFIPRVALWFYEPSYLATFMIFYFAFNYYVWLNSREDCSKSRLLRSLFYVIITTSTAGFLGVALVIICGMFLHKKQARKQLAYIGGGLFVVSYILKLISPFVYNLIIGRIFSGDLDAASGGRISENIKTSKLILNNFFTGLGPGAYSEIYGHPPANVTLELFVSIGVFGFVFGTLWFLRPFFYFQNGHLKNAAIFAYFIFLLVLQVNQSYLRLYHWMFLGVIMGLVYKQSYKGDKSFNRCPNDKLFGDREVHL